MELSYEIIMLFFCLAIVAGWVDTLAGGGGLIVLPAFLIAGMPPDVALATNKLQGSFGTFYASYSFVKKGVVDLRHMWKIIVTVFVGSMAGSWLVLHLDSQSLTAFMPYILMAVAVYFLLSPNLNKHENINKPRVLLFTVLVAPLLGFYDGFFGPGTGSLMALGCVLFYGKTLIDATAHTKVLNFTSNISALIYFIIFGQMAWVIGGVMIVGQIIGAWLGVRTVLNHGEKILRPVIVSVCVLMALKILLDN